MALALRTPRPAGVFCHMRSPWAPARLGSRGSSTRRARRLNEQRPHWFPGAAGSGWEAELRPCCSVQPASSLCNQQVLCAAAATPWGGGREGHLRGWRGAGAVPGAARASPEPGRPQAWAPLPSRRREKQTRRLLPQDPRRPHSTCRAAPEQRRAKGNPADCKDTKLPNPEPGHKRRPPGVRGSAPQGPGHLFQKPSVDKWRQRGKRHLAQVTPGCSRRGAAPGATGHFRRPATGWGGDGGRRKNHPGSWMKGRMVRVPSVKV